MSSESKPQDTRDEPKQDVKPADQLTDEELDNVAGGSPANPQLVDGSLDVGFRFKYDLQQFSGRLR